MKNKRQIISDAIVASALMAIAVGTLFPIVAGRPVMGVEWNCYVYAAGAVALLLVRLFNPCKSNDLRLNRLYRSQTWSAMFFCVAAFFMFWPGGAMRDWISLTLVGAIVQIIASIRIPARERKINNSQAD